MTPVTSHRALFCRYAIRLCAILWFAGGMSGVGTASLAEVMFERSVTGLRVTTNHASIADVLSSLSESYNVRYHTTIRLDRGAQPTYSGSLRDVITRVLEGYNYVLRSEQNAVEVTIIGNKGSSPVASQAVPAAPTKTIASQWK
jgi:hypothetical protein